MRQTEQIRATSKFQTRHDWETLEVGEALSKLKSGSGCYYNYAERKEDGRVKLRRTAVSCPYCKKLHLLKNRREITREQLRTMDAWEDAQLSVFDRESSDKLVLFFTEGKIFTCPCCGETSDVYGKHADISIIREKAKVILRCEVKGWSNILKLPYLPTDELMLEFPFYEQIEFNFRNGHICVREVTKNGKILHTVDCTSDSQLLNKTELAG